MKALTKLAISTIMLMPGCTPPFTHLFLPKPDPKIPLRTSLLRFTRSGGRQPNLAPIGTKTSTTGIGMRSNGPTLRSTIKDGSPGFLMNGMRSTSATTAHLTALKCSAKWPGCSRQSRHGAGAATLRENSSRRL